MLNEPFDFNGNFFTSSLSPKIFGIPPKRKSRPKIWIYPYYSLPLPGLILLHNSKVFKLLNKKFGSLLTYSYLCARNNNKRKYDTNRNNI